MTFFAAFVFMVADIYAGPLCPYEPGTWGYVLHPGCWLVGFVDVLVAGLIVTLLVLPMFVSLRQSRKVDASSQGVRVHGASGLGVPSTQMASGVVSHRSRGTVARHDVTSGG